MDVTWFTESYCYILSLWGVLCVFLIISFLSLFLIKYKEYFNNIFYFIFYSSIFYLPLFFLFSMCRCTVDETLATWVYVIDNDNLGTDNLFKKKYLFDYPGENVKVNAIYVKNTTDSTLVVYSTAYGNESEEESIVVPPHSFVEIPYQLSYYFETPPEFIRTSIRNRGATRWSIDFLYK